MTDAQLIEAAQQIASELSPRSQEIEQARQLPPDIAKRMARAQLQMTRPNVLPWLMYSVRMPTGL